MPSMPSTGPLSYQGSPVLVQDKTFPPLSLRVNTSSKGLAGDGTAAVHPASCLAWAAAWGGQATCFAALATGSDCVISLRRDETVPQGCIELDEVQQLNLHIAPGETYGFSVFTPPADEPFELVELDAEVRLLHSVGRDVEVDAEALARQLGNAKFGRVAAVSEQLLLRAGEGVELVARVTAVDSRGPEGQELVGYHCYRGLVTPNTAIFITADASRRETGSAAQCSGTMHHRSSHAEPCSSCDTSESDVDMAAAASHQLAALQLSDQPRGGTLRLRKCRTRAHRPASVDLVEVHTRDGETFPVLRKLLRPCIALTRAVRPGGPRAADEVVVNVDTCIFDRVLIYLEAEATGRPAPNFGVHLTEGLLSAAQTVGLRSLEEQCRRKMGELESRVRVYSFEEIKRRNAAGECWLILDGMVLDVTRWLPEHPGGDTIIPAQALDMDCARFFEVYHSSRESFCT